MREPALQDRRTGAPSAGTTPWWTREDIILLILLGVFVLLPGLGAIPLFDRDEPRFATAARTMQESGDYLVPHFNGALRPDKPPLVYWLMDIAYWATGRAGELGARLPSAISGIGTLLAVYFMVGCRLGRLTGMVASVMLGTCVLFMAESRMATADGTMLFFITVCMACAWQAWDAGGALASGRTPLLLPRSDYLLDRTGEKPPLVLDHLPATAPRQVPLWLALVFWVSLAAGTLTKGVPLLFVLLPMMVLSIVTGQLPGQLRIWRSHFHLTRTRIGAALAVAAGVGMYVVIVNGAHLWTDTWAWAVVIGAILIGMLLLPGLPGILVRCFAGANWRWWRHLRPLVGVPLLVILVSWWVIAAGRATDWKLIKDMVGVHFLNRTAGPLMHAFGWDITEQSGGTVDPMKSYGKPPGFYLLTVWGTFWPWCVLLVPAGYHAVRRLLGKTALAIDPRPYQFLVTWIVPMWIVLELARGKLFHYPLPLYPALAILCADTLVQSWNRLTDVLAAKWFDVTRWVTLVIWLGIGAGLLIATKQTMDIQWLYRILPFSAALMAIGFASTWTWGKPSWPFVLVLTWAGALLVMNTLVLPDLPALQVSRVIGGRMAEVARDNPDVHFAGRGYEEPTLVFYAGKNVEMFDSLDELLAKARFERTAATTQSAATTPSADPQWLVAINEETRAELEARGIHFAYVVPFINGVNTGNFKPTSVALITNRIPPAQAPGTAASTRPLSPLPPGPATIPAWK